MDMQTVFASAIKSPIIIEAVKDVCSPLADAVFSELYPYIYFSLILVTLSFILQIAVMGILIRYARIARNNS